MEARALLHSDSSVGEMTAQVVRYCLFLKIAPSTNLRKLTRHGPRCDNSIGVWLRHMASP